MKKENRFFLLDRGKEKGLKGRLKNAFYAAQYLFFRISYPFVRVTPTEKKYRVAICAIFKNEAPYLREWLEYNHIVGVEHFYLYNNNSEDSFREILQPYIDSGLVTLIEWPHDQKQMECYMDCIERFSGETRWLGFIDIDEFIVPNKVDSIYEFLKPFEKKRGSVAIYWRLFGSSGRMDRDLNGLVTEDFTVCWPKYCDIGKCFYNTAFGFDTNAKYAKQLHHHLWAKKGGMNLPPVNCFDKPIVGNMNVGKAGTFPIQINHYFTKSYHEYAMKRAKGDVYFQVNPHDEAYFFEHETECSAVDYSAYRYLIRLKQAMETKA